jgi:archaellum biogenesis ATPase FlaH
MNPSYKELLPRVQNMVRRRREDELENNLIDLPTAFERAATRKTDDSLTVPGWHRFNDASKGLRPHEFTILCGPTGVGKTTLLANLQLGFISANIPSFSAPVEVGSEDFVQKMASIISCKPMIETQQHWDEVRKKYQAQFFSNPMHVLTTYDTRVPHTQLMCDLLHSYETNGTKIALIDNLNFMMDSAGSRDQISAMDRVIHEWIVFVKRLPIHVIMVMHPRKTENGRVESENDIKGSSTSIQEAQNVILFNRLKDDEEAPYDDSIGAKMDPHLCREIKIVKCRKNGRAVGKRIIYKIDAISEMYTEKKMV